MDTAKELFRGWAKEEILIAACVEGVMGSLATYGDCVAAATVGDFTFLAGDAESGAAQEALSAPMEAHKNGFCLAVPENDLWQEKISAYFGDKCKAITRYAIQKEGDCFDRVHLRTLALKLPEDIEIVPIGEEEYHATRGVFWSRDFCSQYPTYADYASLSLGYVAKDGGEIVAGVSGYCRSRDALEIEIGTLPEFRRQGIASALAARFILTCLDRGLYPSWDASNIGSVRLAEKLGYHLKGEYVTLLIQA